MKVDIFRKIAEICNNSNIGLTGFATEKKSSNKMLPP